MQCMMYTLVHTCVYDVYVHVVVTRMMTKNHLIGFPSHQRLRILKKLAGDI